MEITKTTRGSDKILLDGYSYILDRKRENKSYWRCSDRGKCGSRLTTNGSEILIPATKHSHPPDLGRISAIKMVDRIKTKARESDEITSAIMQQCTQDFPLDATSSLPNPGTLSRFVRRQRAPPDGELVRGDLLTTTRGEDFVLLDNEAMTILATPKNLSLLSEKSHWLGDGTFDTAPSGCQLYTIHALVDEFHTIPLVYCVMKRKNTECYDSIFTTLLNERSDLYPSTFTIDFEKSMINSIGKNFPETTITGCFFHFGQCFYRCIQRSGLQSWYAAPKNSRIIKSYQSLAFVPVDDVSSAFVELTTSLENDTFDTISPFIGYFESTWIGSFSNGRRRNPMFGQSMWNMYQRTINNLPRTTNSLEGWHRAFEQRVNITHPTPARLVGKIKREQARWELTMEQMSLGKYGNTRHKRFVKANELIREIVQNYQKESVLIYLDKLAGLI